MSQSDDEGRRESDVTSTNDAPESAVTEPRERVTPDEVARRMTLAENLIAAREPVCTSDDLVALAKEVVRLRDYAEECHELLEADRGWDVLDDVDKRLRKLYMGLNGEQRWRHGVVLMEMFGVDASDVPPVDLEGDSIDQWDRLVSLTVWATTYAVAQGRWAVVEHRQADRLRDALLNGVDWFTGTEKPLMPRRVGHDYTQDSTTAYVEGWPCMICGIHRAAHEGERQGEQVRVVHAEQNRGEVGTVVASATQAGMDVVVRFASGHLAEFRRWELDTLRPDPVAAHDPAN